LKQKLSKKAKIIISSIGALLLVLGIIAYWAADRFLFEHVELDLSNMEMPAANGDLSVLPSENLQVSPDGGLQVTPSVGLQVTPNATLQVTPNATLQVTPGKALQVTTNGASKGGTKTAGASKGNTPTAGASKGETPNKGAAGPEKYTATETSYKSDTKSIEIKKVVTGEGNDTVTYFVADVKLTDAAQLKSAFAKNKFGRNIIQNTSVIAKNNDAILAINGDYYGFRADGIILRNGRLFRNVPSPRTGLAFYKDGSMKFFKEDQITGQELLKNGVINTISFGPALLIDGKLGTDLDTYRVDYNIGSTVITGLQPRTGVGMIDKNHFVFVVVDGRNKGHSKGMELEEFAKVFQGLGCRNAYNIDGGGSATMYFMGKVINIPSKKVERGTSDIFYIK
jgi:exopolysaccharide biosynthesis protein